MVLLVTILVHLRVLSFTRFVAVVLGWVRGGVRGMTRPGMVPLPPVARGHLRGVVVRASARERKVAGSIPRRVIPKDVNIWYLLVPAWRSALMGTTRTGRLGVSIMRPSGVFMLHCGMVFQWASTISQLKSGLVQAAAHTHACTSSYERIILKHDVKPNFI